MIRYQQKEFVPGSSVATRQVARCYIPLLCGLALRCPRLRTNLIQDPESNISGSPGKCLGLPQSNALSTNVRFCICGSPISSPSLHVVHRSSWHEAWHEKCYHWLSLEPNFPLSRSLGETLRSVSQTPRELTTIRR
jgi:hypothetical protein